MCAVGVEFDIAWSDVCECVFGLHAAFSSNESVFFLPYELLVVTRTQRVNAALEYEGAKSKKVEQRNNSIREPCAPNQRAY